VEESSENETDTNTGSGETDSSASHTDVLGDFDHGVGDFRGVGAAGCGLGDGTGEDGGGLLTLEGLESGGLAGGFGHGRESTLGSNIAADHWAGDLGCGGGHEGGHLGGNHSCSHCERCVCVRERKDEASKE